MRSLAVLGLSVVVGCGAVRPTPARDVPEPSASIEEPPEREAIAAVPWPSAPPSEAVALEPFASKKAWDAWLKRKTSVEEMRAVGNMWGAGAQESGEGLGLGGIGTIGDGAGSESVTNVQHAGVDEGGIVKVHGDHLVVLRRGRLFTLRISDLAVTSQIDAYPPLTDPRGTWYDEMLVWRDTIVVVGYSYARGGTEIGLFDIDADGRMHARATYHLRSDDYYSSRDYASRLVGDKLIFYAPLAVRGGERWMPALRKWHPGARDSEFTGIIEPSSIDAPLAGADEAALHTVTVCDLAKREMTCKARGVIAAQGRVFYVAPDAVYVWTTPWTPADDGVARSIVYRMPLDDASAVTAIRARGAPTDSFSFLEKDGVLNVLLRADSSGDAMWQAERDAIPGTAIALLRVPTGSFSRAVREPRTASYVGLPSIAAGGVLQNRFVGDRVLYGTGTTWGWPDVPRDARVTVFRAGGADPAMRIALGHGVDRIEALGDDAVVIGADREDLHFSALSLQGGARVASRFTRHDASQAETRSHGFFYRSDADGRGLFGLPIRAGGEPGYEQLREAAASIVFVANDKLRFRELGSLDARAPARDDACKASCVDWYGNTRPLFLRGRLFALLGYEIVEGRVDTGRVVEVRRATFAPGTSELTMR
jgi:hypothetical protein